MDILILLIFSISNITCFYIGAKVGQKVVKGERIETPNPARDIDNYRAKKKAERSQNKLDVIMRNIDKYDGTSIGQEDVPRG